MTARLRTIAALCLVLLATGCRGDESSGRTTSPTPATELVDALGSVESIVDGDTIDVVHEGVATRVRLIGIDTPETVSEDEPVECYGQEATTFLRELLPPGTTVTLLLDAEPRDRYGRLLAYVHRADDGLFVNEIMLREGYADTLSIRPNTFFEARFATIAAEARAAGRGLWGSCE